MSKEYLEALERLAMPDELHINECKRLGIGLTEDYDILKQYFESIDNSKPSEASIDTATEMLLTELEMLSDCAVAIEEEPSSNWIEYAETAAELDLKLHFAYLDIKQSLLKAQKQEKEIAYIEKIKTMIKQKNCALRYIESEDCFAVRTILSDGWYKLTPEFVENNVSEEIKPLPLIEKNKQLKEENAELKKVLEAIKKHFIIKFEEDDVKGDVWGRLISIQSKEDEGDWDTTACANIVDYKEDFELLKRWLE